ncbi:MAG: hypothetical protein ACRD20_18985 [Terriglobales bacterium]
MTDSRKDLDPALANDQDRGKGAVEEDGPQESGNTSMSGQLGHRDQDPLLKSSDSDFPEPGGSPEHTGEPTEPKKRDVA